MSAETKLRRTAAIQVVSGLEVAHGGPSYSVPGLHRALCKAGIEDRIFADLVPGEPANDVGDGIITLDRQFGTVPFLRKLHISGAMSRRLLDPAEVVDLIHSHGLWRMPNIYAARAARQRSIPHVVSPRGMLSEVALELSSHSKRLFAHWGQTAAMGRAACFHATSAAEHDDIRRFGIRAPIVVVPNGVDLPVVPDRSSGRDRKAAAGQRTLLFLGRVHPIKGVDRLVTAWHHVAAQFPQWRLRIIGPGEAAHLAQVRGLIERLGVPRVAMEGPLEGAEKLAAYADADLFVQPSISENFGLTIAESLACRRPVIATKGTPWAGLETHSCGWWIETGEEALVAALQTGLGMPEDILDAMGRRGEAWVRQEFAWDGIGVAIANVYRWLLGTGAKPDCVKT